MEKRKRIIIRWRGGGGGEENNEVEKEANVGKKTRGWRKGKRIMRRRKRGK